MHDRGSQLFKDKTSRDIISALDTAGIGVASTTFEVVGLPPLHAANGAHVKVS